MRKSSVLRRIHVLLKSTTFLIFSLEDAEKKLHETVDEFDQSKQEAKSAKDAFQAVKDKRYFPV